MKEKKRGRIGKKIKKAENTSIIYDGSKNKTQTHLTPPPTNNHLAGKYAGSLFRRRVVPTRILMLVMMSAERTMEPREVVPARWRAAWSVCVARGGAGGAEGLERESVRGIEREVYCGRPEEETGGRV